MATEAERAAEKVRLLSEQTLVKSENIILGLSRQEKADLDIESGTATEPVELHVKIHQTPSLEQLPQTLDKQMTEIYSEEIIHRIPHGIIGREKKTAVFWQQPSTTRGECRVMTRPIEDTSTSEYAMDQRHSIVSEYIDESLQQSKRDEEPPHTRAAAESRQELNKKAKEFFDERLDQLKSKLKASEGNLKASLTRSEYAIDSQKPTEPLDKHEKKAETKGHLAGLLDISEFAPEETQKTGKVGKEPETERKPKTPKSGVDEKHETVVNFEHPEPAEEEKVLSWVHDQDLERPPDSVEERFAETPNPHPRFEVPPTIQFEDLMFDHMGFTLEGAGITLQKHIIPLPGDEEEKEEQPLPTPSEIEEKFAAPVAYEELEADYQWVTQEVRIMITPFPDADPKDFNENRIRAVLHLQPDELRINQKKLWAPRVWHQRELAY